MEIDHYQNVAATTAKDSIRGDIIYATLGLAAEAGEFANIVKKQIRDGVTDSQQLVDELGDALWYVAACATALGYPLSYLAETNLSKLAARHPAPKPKFHVGRDFGDEHYDPCSDGFFEPSVIPTVPTRD